MKKEIKEMIKYYRFIYKPRDYIILLQNDILYIKHYNGSLVKWGNFGEHLIGKYIIPLKIEDILFEKYPNRYNPWIKGFLEEYEHNIPK